MSETPKARIPRTIQSQPTFAANPAAMSVNATKKRTTPCACVGLAPIPHLTVEFVGCRHVPTWTQTTLTSWSEIQNERLWRLKRRVAAIAIPDANGLRYFINENLAVSDLARTRGVAERLYHFVGPF